MHTSEQGNVPPETKLPKAKPVKMIKKKNHRRPGNGGGAFVDISQTGTMPPNPGPPSSSLAGKPSASQNHGRALPTVGAFAVQCAACFKWRLAPTKQKYEEIRETLLQDPFICEKAREWRPGVSCEDAPDISQDGSRIWAIDKPNIARPPPGWERILKIRGEGSAHFADLYYTAPSGKRLRSMVEVEKYLLEHQEYADQGVSISQFSFLKPRPLQDNYVRKRSNAREKPRAGSSGPANPASWLSPDASTDLQLGPP